MTQRATNVTQPPRLPPCTTTLLLPTSSTHIFFFFFFNDTATTEIYTLSLHDALPISLLGGGGPPRAAGATGRRHGLVDLQDRKSTRLNSSHPSISYAVFCLKKKKKIKFNDVLNCEISW